MAEERIIILGTGSQASVVLDILQSAGHADRVEGFIACGDESVAVEAELDDRPILGGLNDLPDLHARGVRLAALAVQSALVRERVLQQVLTFGFGLISAIHPSAVIGNRVKVGRGVVICANAVIVNGSEIGQGCIVSTGATVEDHCGIGEFAFIGPGTHLASNVRVGNAAWVGIGCSVVQGVSIGARSRIGPGSAVISDIPEGVLAFGVPAQVQHPYDPSETVV